MTSEILQFSPVSALMAGMIDGHFRAGDLRALGDFGLASPHELSGEITLADGVFFEAGSDRRVRNFGDDELLSFAQITTFEPEHVLTSVDVRNGTLYARLRERLPLDNIFVAYRISGMFERIRVRRPVRQRPPYRPMLDIMKEQVEDEYQALWGSVYGFWSPSFFDKLSVPRFHAHFLTDDRAIGGHVLDFSIPTATVEFERKTSIRLVLPEIDDYLDRDLSDPSMSEIIDRIEH